LKQNTKYEIIFSFSRNLSQVEYLVDKYGLEIFKERDEYGHSPAHWMALNGHASIARYMATKCGALDLHSDNSQGPRPIHWASRNGHVAVVDILLSAGKV
jgi:ankyrin repeat protein